MREVAHAETVVLERLASGGLPKDEPPDANHVTASMEKVRQFYSDVYSMKTHAEIDAEASNDGMKMAVHAAVEATAPCAVASPTLTLPDTGAANHDAYRSGEDKRPSADHVE